MPIAFHSVYPLHSIYVAPSAPSPAGLARHIAILVLFHIAPFPLSLVKTYLRREEGGGGG
jgi:hypothetical protein